MGLGIDNRYAGHALDTQSRESGVDDARGQTEPVNNEPADRVASPTNRDTRHGLDTASREEALEVLRSSSADTSEATRSEIKDPSDYHDAQQRLAETRPNRLARLLGRAEIDTSNPAHMRALMEHLSALATSEPKHKETASWVAGMALFASEPALPESVLRTALAKASPELVQDLLLHLSRGQVKGDRATMIQSFSRAMLLEPKLMVGSGLPPQTLQRSLGNTVNILCRLGHVNDAAKLVDRFADTLGRDAPASRALYKRLCAACADHGRRGNQIPKPIRTQMYQSLTQDPTVGDMPAEHRGILAEEHYAYMQSVGREAIGGLIENYLDVQVEQLRDTRAAWQAAARLLNDPHASRGAKAAALVRFCEAAEALGTDTLGDLFIHSHPPCATPPSMQLLEGFIKKRDGAGMLAYFENVATAAGAAYDPSLMTALTDAADHALAQPELSRTRQELQRMLQHLDRLDPFALGPISAGLAAEFGWAPGAGDPDDPMHAALDAVHRQRKNAETALQVARITGEVAVAVVAGVFSGGAALAVEGALLANQAREGLARLERADLLVEVRAMSEEERNAVAIEVGVGLVTAVVAGRIGSSLGRGAGRVAGRMASKFAAKEAAQHAVRQAVEQVVESTVSGVTGKSVELGADEAFK